MYFLPPKPGQPITQSNYIYGNQRSNNNTYQARQKQLNSNRQLSNEPAVHLQSQNNQQRASNQHQPRRGATIPADLFEITRKQFSFLKALHHINCIETSTPKTWLAWANNINTNTRFAFDNNETKSKIESITNNLLSQLQNCAITHYNKVRADSITFLKEHSRKMDEDTFSASINLTKSWAKRQLSKLRPETLEEAIKELASFHQTSDYMSTPLVISFLNGRRIVKLGTASPTQVIPTNTSSLVSNNSENATAAEFNNNNEVDNLLLEVAQSMEAQTNNKPLRISVKQTKPDNSSRFFMHSQQREPEAIESEQPSSQTSWSQSSIASHIGPLPVPNNGVVSFQLSIKETAATISETKLKTIMLADANWKNYIPPSSINERGFGVLICSGKVTTVRGICDLIKKNNNIEKFILHFSSNNFNAPSASKLLNNINKALKNKLPFAKIFVSLIGVSNSLNNIDKQSIEIINELIRNTNNFVLINPPDNFTTLNDSTFNDETRKQFFSTTSSFLC